MQNKIGLVVALLLLAPGIAFAHSQSAERVTAHAEVNGTDYIEVSPSDTIEAYVEAELTDGFSHVLFHVFSFLHPEVNADWEATAYRFDDGEWACVDHADQDDSVSGTDTDDITFDITAPNEPGTYSVSFRVSGDDDCDSQNGNVLTLEDAVEVIAPEEEPEDMCPNIEGTQEELPEGYVLDDENDCVLEDDEGEEGGEEGGGEGEQEAVVEAPTTGSGQSNCFRRPEQMSIEQCAHFSQGLLAKHWSERGILFPVWFVGGSNDAFLQHAQAVLIDVLQKLLVIQQQVAEL